MYSNSSEDALKTLRRGVIPPLRHTPRVSAGTTLLQTKGAKYDTILLSAVTFIKSWSDFTFERYR